MSGAEPPSIVNSADHVRPIFRALDTKDLSALATIAEFDVHYTRLGGGEVILPCCNVFRLRDALVPEYRSNIDATPVYS